MLSAEYGGTGNKPIQQGMIVEEPDIEIGAGVSSKGMCCVQKQFCQLTFLAMSKRIATDQGGRRGPQSSNRDDHGRDRDRRRNDRYRDDDRRDDRSNSNPNMIPFPMNFPTMPNGMPMLPPGFPFPFPQQNQDGGDKMQQ